MIAVIGGTFVFSLFLKIGYDAFHLSHAPGVRLPGGVPVFREQTAGRSPEDVLAGAGLKPGRVRAFAGRRDHGRLDARVLERRSPAARICSKAEPFMEAR